MSSGLGGRRSAAAPVGAHAMRKQREAAELGRAAGCAPPTRPRRDRPPCVLGLEDVHVVSDGDGRLEVVAGDHHNADARAARRNHGFGHASCASRGAMLLPHPPHGPKTCAKCSQEFDHSNAPTRPWRAASVDIPADQVVAFSSTLDAASGSSKWASPQRTPTNSVRVVFLIPLKSALPHGWVPALKPSSLLLMFLLGSGLCPCFGATHIAAKLVARLVSHGKGPPAERACSGHHTRGGPHELGIKCSGVPDAASSLAGSRCQHAGLPPAQARHRASRH